MREPTIGLGRHTIYIHGVLHSPFALATVVSTKRVASFAALLVPMDQETWILSFVAFLTCVVAFVGLTYTTKKEALKNIRDKLFWSTSVLLVQMDETFTLKQFKKGYKLAACFGTWYFFCFIIGLVYSGGLFASLTTPVPPQVPQDLKGFVDAKFPIFTTTPVMFDSLVTSFLKRVTIPDFKKGLNEFDSLYKFLINLEQRITFLYGEGAAIAHKLSEGLRIQSDTGAPPVALDSSLFAILDVTERLEPFLQGVNVFLNRSFIRRHGEVDLFQQRSFFSEDVNFFYPFFSKILGQLEESGLLGRWEKTETIIRRMLEIKRTVDKRESRMFFIRSFYPWKNPVHFEEADNVSIAAMKYAFSLCAIALILSIGVFVVENYQVFLNWRNIVGMLNNIVRRVINMRSRCKEILLLIRFKPTAKRGMKRK